MRLVYILIIKVAKGIATRLAVTTDGQEFEEATGAIVSIDASHRKPPLLAHL